MIDECLSYVKRFSPVGHFTPHEQYMLASVGVLQRLEAGDYLCRQGEPPTAVYFVVSGRLECLRPLDSGRQVTLYRVGADRIIGQAALLAFNAHTVSIRACEPSEVIAYPRAAFERHFNAQSRFANKVVDLMVSQLAEQLRDANLALTTAYADPFASEARLKSIIEELASSPNIELKPE